MCEPLTNEPLKPIPADVAVCPECGRQLLGRVNSYDRLTGRPEDMTVVCASDPTMRNHSSIPGPFDWGESLRSVCHWYWASVVPTVSPGARYEAREIVQDWKAWSSQ